MCGTLLLLLKTHFYFSRRYTLNSTAILHQIFWSGGFFVGIYSMGDGEIAVFGAVVSLSAIVAVLSGR